MNWKQEGERIDKLLETLEERDTVKAEDFFHPQPHMDELIERSKETKIAGVTLTVCIDKGMGAFRTSLQNGAIIKLILIDGSEESFHACSVRSDTNSISYFRKKHATTMDNIDYLMKYSNRPEIKGRVLVRRIPYPPTTGIEIFKDDEKSSIKVEIYPQHTGWDRPPIFTVDSKKDENWFVYFENQFDAIWNRGTDYIVNAQNTG